MGLISRVSSRTYREVGHAYPISKMFRLTRLLRSHAYPAQGTAKHAGYNPGAPKQPSATIQTCRWLALIAGIWWGNKRYAELKAQRPAERAEEIAARDALVAACEAAKEKANAEFAADSVLYGTAK